jgi:HNH endonuclease
MGASAAQRIAVQARRREVMRLRDLGLPWQEIADRVGLPAAAAATRDYQRAMRPGALAEIVPLRCGSKTAYNRHRAAGESCEVCRLAENERSRARGAGGSPASCSSCGVAIKCSPSSRPLDEIQCRSCRTSSSREIRTCARPGCAQTFTVYKKAGRRFCSQACAWLEIRGRVGRDPDKVRANNRRKRARRLAVASDVTAEVERRMRATAVRCPLCAVRLVDEPFTPASKELDHIVPLGIGGADVIGNVRIICRLCNLRRPKDGSDLAGIQLGLWGAEPMWPPRARPVKPVRLCPCGSPTGRESGKSGLCGDCVRERGTRAAVLRAGGWSWSMIAAEIGVASAGAAYNAAQLGRRRAA